MVNTWHLRCIQFIPWYWSHVTCGQRTCKVIAMIKRNSHMLFVRVTLCMCYSASPARVYRKWNQTDIFKVLSNISGFESIVVLKWWYFHRHKNDFFLAYIEIPCIRTKVRSMFHKKNSSWNVHRLITGPGHREIPTREKECLSKKPINDRCQNYIFNDLNLYNAITIIKEPLIIYIYKHD